MPSDSPVKISIDAQEPMDDVVELQPEEQIAEASTESTQGPAENREATAPTSAEAELTAEVATAEGKVRGRPKGKGKAKAKGKGKAKGKAKGRAKGKAKASADGDGCGGDGTPKAGRAKAKAMSFKSQVLKDLGDRDLDEVLAEAAADVERCQQAIKEAELAEADAAEAEVALSATIAEVTARVEASKAEESEALERLRAARGLCAGAAAAVRQAQVDRAEVAAAAKILDLDLANREKHKELEDAKSAARDAADAARRQLEEARAAARDVQEQLKAIQLEQCEQEALAVSQHNEADRAGAEAKKELKITDRAARREALQEISHLERLRAQREKERLNNFRLAAGFGGRSHKLLAISNAGDGAPPEAMDAVNTGGAGEADADSADAKRPRIEDVN